jgi:hypothetical protein
MHNISFFSQFVVDEYIAKGGEWFSMSTKLVELFAYRVVERRNMIISMGESYLSTGESLH